MEELIKMAFDKLSPLELLYLIPLAAMGYALKEAFARLTKITDDRVKMAEKRDKQSLQYKQSFETYVSEHRHEHNQLDNRLNHMNAELVEIRKDTGAVRDSQIRVETKLDILLENRIRNKNEKN